MVLEAIFSCFCKWCQEKYFVDYGKSKNYQKKIGNYFKEFKVRNKNNCPYETHFIDILNHKNFENFYNFKKQVFIKVN